MAKFIFYLCAKAGRFDQLVHACEAFSTCELVLTQKLDVAVLQPSNPDMLAVPAQGEFIAALDLVCEIMAPAGCPLESLKAGLKVAMSPLLEWVVPGKSHVVSAWSRAFQESGRKPQRYHYIMVRNAQFSRADYMDYYSNRHYRFGVATPLADYYQNEIDTEHTAAVAALFGVNAVAADSVSELRFDDVEAYLFSDAVRRIGPAASSDEEVFVDRRRCQSFSMNVLLDTRNYTVASGLR